MDEKSNYFSLSVNNTFYKVEITFLAVKRSWVQLPSPPHQAENPHSRAGFFVSERTESLLSGFWRKQKNSQA